MSLFTLEYIECAGNERNGRVNGEIGEPEL